MIKSACACPPDSLSFVIQEKEERKNQKSFKRILSMSGKDYKCFYWFNKNEGLLQCSFVCCSSSFARVTETFLWRFHLRDKDEKYRTKKLSTTKPKLFSLHSFEKCNLFFSEGLSEEATWLYYIRLIAVVESFHTVRSILCLTADRSNLRRFKKSEREMKHCGKFFLALKAICSPTGKTFKHSLALQKNCFSNNAYRYVSTLLQSPKYPINSAQERCSPIYIVKERKIRSSIKHTNSSYFSFSWLFLPFPAISSFLLFILLTISSCLTLIHIIIAHIHAAFSSSLSSPPPQLWYKFLFNKHHNDRREKIGKYICRSFDPSNQCGGEKRTKRMASRNLWINKLNFTL